MLLHAKPNLCHACRPRTCAPSKPSTALSSYSQHRDLPYLSGTGRSGVVAIGEAFFDEIADQKGLPRSMVQSWTSYAGGAPANSAAALGKLGLDTVLVTALGRDESGQALFDLIQKCGVKTHGIQRRDEPTRKVYVLQDENGDREFAGFGLPSEQYCDCFLDAEQLPLEEIQEAAILVTGTLALACPLSRKALTKAVQEAREGDCKIYVDVNWRAVFFQDHAEAKKIIADFLQQADIIKCSEADLEFLLGTDLQTALNDPCLVAEAFPNTLGVLVSAGKEGVAYCFRSPSKGEHSGFVPSFKVKMVDTTGAGDAFSAGFIYKILQAGSLETLASDAVKLKEACVFANAAGALTCTKKGAIHAQPLLHEIEELCNEAQGYK